MLASNSLIRHIQTGLIQLTAVPTTIPLTTCGALFAIGIIPTIETTILGFVWYVSEFSIALLFSLRVNGLYLEN